MIRIIQCNIIDNSFKSLSYLKPKKNQTTGKVLHVILMFLCFFLFVSESDFCVQTSLHSFLSRGFKDLTFCTQLQSMVATRESLALPI